MNSRVALKPNPSRKRARRSDIQSLRAVAVILVILDHLVILQKLPGSPAGGFIGVDIFFVISGFLITQHLISERVGTGRIAFGRFYLRRVRRLLPLALLVIAVTVLASFVIFWPWQASSFALDGLWSALFVSNIAFAIRGVDYFAADQVSIFQHYWSLSVEEQFYLFWPLMLAVAAFFAFRSRHPGRTLFGIAVVVGGLSFVWACYATAVSPTSAYFSTIARAFEFAIGSLIAIAAPRLGGLPRWLRISLSLLGLAGILVSVVVIEPGIGFPGPMALLPTLSAAAFILAGTSSEEPLELWPLNARAVTYVGDISYSLYLWHWPVILILGALIPREIIVIPGALVLTFILAALSYHFVEQPILASSWLKPGEMKRRFTNRRVMRNVTAMTAGLALVAGTVAAGDVALRTMLSLRDEEPPGGNVEMQLDQPAAAEQMVGEIQSMIAGSRDRDGWQDLQPDVSEVGPYGGDLTAECWTRDDGPPRTCLRGNPDAEKTIAVLGDSIAMNAAFAVDRFVEEYPDWNMAVYAKLGCAAPEVPLNSPSGAPYTSCDEFREWAIAEIVASQPDAVWLTSALPRTLRGVSEADIPETWEKGLRTTLQRLESVPEVYVVMPPPAGADLAFCSRPFNDPADCSSEITEKWIQIRDVSAEATGTEDRALVDTALWYCTPDGYCPAVIGDYIVRRDERHLTYEYGSFLSALVAAWVAS